MLEIGISGLSRQAGRLKPLAVIVALGGIALVIACSHGSAAPSAGWDPKAAAAYLDRRMEWWISWKNSARDHGTFCFSCHTAVPYALARPELRTMLAESADAAPRRQLMDLRRLSAILCAERRILHLEPEQIPDQRHPGVDAVVAHVANLRCGFV